MKFQWICTSLLRILAFIFIFPFLSIFFTIFYIYRKFVSFIFKIRNVGRILSSHSSVEYSINNKSDPIIVQVQFKFNGELDFQQFCNRFQTKVIDAKNSINGKLVYPELRQYTQEFLGYVFWIDEENFDISDHIICYKDNDSDSESVIRRDNEYCEKLALGTEIFLPANKSPWLILVVQGVQNDKSGCFATVETTDEKCTFIIFQIHHCLADGLSIFQLISKCADEQVEIYQPKEMSNCEIYLKYLYCPFNSIINSSKNKTGINTDEFWNSLFKEATAEETSSSLGNNDTGIQLLLEKPLKTRHRILSKQIPIHAIKQLESSIDNSSFSSVMLCIFQNGIRTFFNKYKIEIPEQWKTLFTIPAPKHGTTGLTNHIYLVRKSMPTNKDKLLQEQITIYNQHLTKLKKSSSSLESGIYFTLTGLLPIQLRRQDQLYKCFISKRQYFVDLYFSIFPGPNTENIHMLGKSVIELNYLIKARLNTGLSFFIFIFNGKLQFWLETADIFTRQQATELLNCIETEFDNLNAIHH